MELQILIISTSNQKSIFYKTLFKDMGHQASCANDAFNAIKMFINYNKFGMPFDIAFMDYLLPGTNGIHLAQRLLEIDPAVNIVLFPSKFFNLESVRLDYLNFGYFMQKVPEASYAAYKNILTCTIRKKEILHFAPGI